MSWLKAIDLRSYLKNILAIFTTKIYYGWGLKRSGRFARWCAKTFGGKVVLQEDGFIRSIGLGVNGAAAMSIIEDDVGIYYDATRPSQLENLLNSYDFTSNRTLMREASEAIALIITHHISKYNHAPELKQNYFTTDKKRVLIIAQTAGDMALKYGLAKSLSTMQMIDAAIRENPDAQIYLKVHPDVICGKKASDIALESLEESVKIIVEDVNPISLLMHIDCVYTKTSQMGFEALLLGKKCVCFGMPFYAGWGVTDDRVTCERRVRTLTVEEVFAAAYLLYSQYFYPDTKKPCSLFDVIRLINEGKK